MQREGDEDIPSPVSPVSPTSRYDEYDGGGVGSVGRGGGYGGGGGVYTYPLRRYRSYETDDDGPSQSELHYYLSGVIPPPLAPVRYSTVANEKPLPPRPLVSVRPVSGEIIPPARSGRSPALVMSSLVLLGLGFAIAHHFLNAAVDGHVVLGQERVVRGGVALAFLAQAAFVGAIAVAHGQVAWDTVRRKEISIGGVDAMFAATGDLTAFWNVESIRRAKIATTLALLAWIIPIAAIITPGSLTVRLGTSRSTEDISVPLANFSDSTSFIAKLLPTNGTTFGEMIAPSAFLSRIVSTAATDGEILPINLPPRNSSYDMVFHAPSLRCSPSDKQATTVLLDALGAMPSTQYAGIYNPNLSHDTCSVYVGVKTPGGSAKAISCELYNTYYTLNFTFTTSGQRILVHEIEYLNPISCMPLGWSPANLREPPSEFLASYALFSALAQVLVENITYPTTASSSRLLQTPLLGSSDFSLLNLSHADRAKGLFEGPLERGIEELSRNATISLLSAPSLGVTVETVEISRDALLYEYALHSLWIAYGVVAAASLLAVIVGLVAMFLNDGEGLDRRFVSVLAATQSGEVEELVRGSDPRCRRVSERRIRFARLSNGDRRFVLTTGLD